MAPDEYPLFYCSTVERDMPGHRIMKVKTHFIITRLGRRYYDKYFKKQTTHIQSHLGYLVVIIFISKFNPHVVLCHVLPSKPSFRGHLGALMELRSPLSIS